VSLLDELLDDAPIRPALAPVESFRAALAPTVRDGLGSAIGSSDDLERVVALPRRAPLDVDNPDDPRTREVVARMNARLGRPNRACTCARHSRPCVTSLKPAQAWALAEIAEIGGLVGPIGVGHGKTGLGILAPMVLRSCRVAVLLIPPNLVKQLEREHDLWSQHFHVPSLRFGHAGGTIIAGRPVIHVLPYSRLSRPESTTALEALRPDLVIADEAHKLRDRKSATTGRVVRYMVSHPETRFVAWSGTVAKGSVVDFTHLAAFALREGSPTPLDPSTAAAWATALDPLPVRAKPGHLLRLGVGRDETLADAFGRRLADTAGWVSTKGSSIPNALTLRERVPPRMPDGLAKMLSLLRSTWTRPDGEEFVDVLQVAKSARELACGFFYRWKFPRGEPEPLIRRWYAARKAWHRELRQKLERPEEHLDSEKLCSNAAERHLDGYTGPLPTWATATFRAWRDVRDEVAPVTDTVWLDKPPPGFDAVPGADYLVDDAAEWATKNRGVVWYEHDAFGERVAQRAGLVKHAGGPGAEPRILAETGRHSIVASIKAHGTGRDGLQRRFSTQLVTNPLSSGDGWEQLLGRLHRIGQDADEVETWVYRHTAELRDGIDKAIEQARFLRSTLRGEQKLLLATIEWDDAA